MDYKYRKHFKNRDMLNAYIVLQPPHLKDLYAAIADRIPEYKDGFWTVYEEVRLPRDNQNEPPYEVGGYANIRVEFTPFVIG